VDGDDYAASFGYQWNRFRAVQIDSLNGTSLSRKRFHSETEWTPEWMGGKWLLDAGCGSGRFLDVVAGSGAHVVGLDLTTAVDAARASLIERPNVQLVQASILAPPFRPGVFDGCYCIGVLQHTPDPLSALAMLPGLLKPGGRLAVTAYERKAWTKLSGKYLIRPITRRLNPESLLFWLRTLMPILFPVTEVLFRIAFLRRLFMFGLPVANYVHASELSLRQRYQWALLDTFDMLSPRYDQPQTEEGLQNVLRRAGLSEIKRTRAAGLNLVAAKPRPDGTSGAS